MDAVSNVADLHKCSVCGASFPDSDLIQYDNAQICPSCKPAFFQKLKEGADLPIVMHYAGFWKRGVAVFIDGIIYQVFSIALFFAFGLSVFTPQHSVEAAKLTMILWFVNYAVWIAYATFFVGRFGATPGKMVLGIKVVNADGGKVSYLKAFGRVFAYFLSSFILAIGLIMAAFDREKRALHDRICNTRVIRKQKD